MRRIVGVLVLLAAMQGTGFAWGQCQSDTDCKGRRICRQGECLEPERACGTDMDCPGAEVCEAGS